jgi:hypothetical protein
MIKTNGGQYASVNIDGTSYEQVVPDTRVLLSAVKNDTVDQFLVAHPTWGSSAGASSNPSTSPTSTAPHA